MKKLSFLTACVFTLIVSQAQSDVSNPVRQKSLNASVNTLDGRTIKGRLYSVNDSQLVLLKSSWGQYIIPAENIQSFKLRRKNSELKGALIGFGIGTVTGIVAGFASGDDALMEPSINDFGISAAINNMFAMTAREKAAVYGTSLGITGAIVGALVGVLAKKKFTIGGKKAKFRDLQAEIMMKLVRK